MSLICTIFRYYFGWEYPDFQHPQCANKLRQNMAATMGGRLKADIDTAVRTIGIRGEHRFNPIWPISCLMQVCGS